MNNFDDDDKRWAVLLGQAALEIPDDGFTNRVLTSLPPRPSRMPALLISAGLAAGVAIAWLGLSLHPEDRADFRALVDSTRLVASVLGSPQIVLGLAVAAFSLAISYLFIRQDAHSF